MFWFWIIEERTSWKLLILVPHPLMGSHMGSAKFLPYHSILFLYLDEEVDLINELFVGHFSLKTKRASHPSSGNGDQLWVGLLPILPVSQGLNMGLGRLAGCLYMVPLLSRGRR